MVFEAALGDDFQAQGCCLAALYKNEAVARVLRLISGLAQKDNGAIKAL